jgi:hypothetical protein
MNIYILIKYLSLFGELSFRLIIMKYRKETIIHMQELFS